MSAEQRKSLRFPVINGAFAAFSPQSRKEFIKSGQIIDISKTGLALTYIAPKAYRNSSSQVSIIGPHGNAVIWKLPCKVIYETDSSDGHSTSLSTKRCGIQFEDLSEQQLSRLQNFIREYGVIAA